MNDKPRHAYMADALMIVAILAAVAYWLFG